MSSRIPPTVPVLILPGHGGSGPEHWQTLWERAHPHFHRVEERDWNAPDRAAWVSSLQTAVHAAGPGTVLVAHSLACLQVAFWAADTRLGPSIRGALLVAPPDPESPAFPPTATGFAPRPSAPFPFPSILVGSENDPYATRVFTESCARDWGSQLLFIGSAGHINAESGLGDWPEGMALLESLMA